MISFAQRVSLPVIFILSGCSTHFSERDLIDCVAAGQIEFNTYERFRSDLAEVGISPSVQVMPYMRMHQAIIARHMLNGDSNPVVETGSIWPIPTVDQPIEESITERMKELSNNHIDETDRLNRRCGKLPKARARENS